MSNCDKLIRNIHNPWPGGTGGERHIYSADPGRAREPQQRVKWYLHAGFKWCHFQADGNKALLYFTAARSGKTRLCEIDVRVVGPCRTPTRRCLSLPISVSATPPVSHGGSWLYLRWGEKRFDGSKSDKNTFHTNFNYFFHMQFAAYLVVSPLMNRLLSVKVNSMQRWFHPFTATEIGFAPHLWGHSGDSSFNQLQPAFTRTVVHSSTQ